jgi:hypothetical protein
LESSGKLFFQGTYKQVHMCTSIVGNSDDTVRLDKKVYVQT